jgi:hypothetical protein
MDRRAFLSFLTVAGAAAATMASSPAAFAFTPAPIEAPRDLAPPSDPSASQGEEAAVEKARWVWRPRRRRRYWRRRRWIWRRRHSWARRRRRYWRWRRRWR